MKVAKFLIWYFMTVTLFFIFINLSNDVIDKAEKVIEPDDFFISWFFMVSIIGSIFLSITISLKLIDTYENN